MPEAADMRAVFYGVHAIHFALAEGPKVQRAVFLGGQGPI